MQQLDLQVTVIAWQQVSTWTAPNSQAAHGSRTISGTQVQILRLLLLCSVRELEKTAVHRGPALMFVFVLWQYCGILPYCVCNPLMCALMTDGLIEGWGKPSNQHYSNCYA